MGWDALAEAVNRRAEVMEGWAAPPSLKPVDRWLSLPVALAILRGTHPALSPQPEAAGEAGLRAALGVLVDHAWVSKSGRPYSVRVKSPACARCGATPDAPVHLRFLAAAPATPTPAPTIQKNEITTGLTERGKPRAEPDGLREAAQAFVDVYLNTVQLATAMTETEWIRFHGAMERLRAALAAEEVR